MIRPKKNAKDDNISHEKYIIAHYILYLAHQIRLSKGIARIVNTTAVK